MAAKNLTKIPSRLGASLRRFFSKKEDSSSFWSYFTGKKTEDKPPAEQCRKRQVVREDPDLSRFGGQPYRTCGSAYVIQKDVIPSCESEQSEEELTLMKMEADLSNKDNVCDPMPPFQTVEQRMLDLTERKLHPFYKRYMAMPKRDREGAEAAKVPYPPYKCKCGPVETDEIPDNLKFNKELLEKKNIFADFKRVELPKQMVVRIVEMEKNRKPTLEKKKK
ncbi:hypothetical protein MTP99_006389 [Tenebrio molitor]|uniref:uncharacterized protein n=1 Tax=Tenebrio molitor TaxID=7067 RepID=UPI0026FB31D3|nr:hypothetical protein MTP99_006389 [Tenebrio molitor]